MITIAQILKNFSFKKVPATRMEDGDAGIVLKANGEFQLFSIGTIDPTGLTERQMEQGAILRAIQVALSVPEVLAVMLTFSDDPTIAQAAGADV